MVMTAHFSRQVPRAPRDVSTGGNAHELSSDWLLMLLAFIHREKPCVWKLDIAFHDFGLAQYFHKKEFYSAATM